MKCPSRSGSWYYRACLVLAGWIGLGMARGVELAAPGFRPEASYAHALVGGKIFTKPGQSLESATVVLRDSRIVAVGPGVEPPADARVWDCRGWVIYAGFLDPYVTVSGTNAVVGSVSAGASGLAGGVGDFTAAGQRFFGVAGQERDPGNRGPGHPLAGVTPERRVVDGLDLDPKRAEEFREIGFTAANVVPSRGLLRGASALVLLGEGSPNQMILRSATAQHMAFETSGGEAFPASSMGVIAALRQCFLDARHYEADWNHSTNHSLERPRPEFNPALEALQPVLRGLMPVVAEPGSALLSERAGDLAREFQLKLQMVASGQEWRRPDLVRGSGAAWIVPLHFPSIPKFPDADGWEGVSLDQLRAWDWAPENPVVLRRAGVEVALTTHGLGERKEFRSQLRLAMDRGLTETEALAGMTTIPAGLCGVADQLGTIEPGKLANLVITDEKGFFDPASKVRAVVVAGRIHELGEGLVRRNAAAGSTNAPPTGGADGEKAKAEARSLEQRELLRKRVAREPQSGRGATGAPPAVLVRHATVWTCGPAGVLKDADLYVVGGRIVSIGPAPETLPTNTWVVDGTGRHVTPGLIDCHNHSMILGGVNEGTLPSTAMVRVADVVNSETPAIHEQLAGGLTVANLLHGSANPIGGQSCVIKLREGATPGGLRMEQAPAGIKFALGENVKQSNWGERFTTRFPQSRMGVGTFFVNRFTAARQYLDELAESAARGGPPVRRDLELEALGEILTGVRWIHCHSYRQDEILHFLRTMEAFGVRVGTLQHVLEGYKVADEIRRHGAGASAFADWWGYKYEVIDAIPYAGSLMHARGVLVSFNSDSGDHARRLNLEAAKAVKYGGTAEAEALLFVTLNPARQLRIDRWVGSLEPGKDGDFVLWSGHPLDSGSHCLETWIEGRRYFSRDLEVDRVKALNEERDALVAKARRSQDAPGGAPPGDRARQKFFESALEIASGFGVHECRSCALPRMP